MKHSLLIAVFLVGSSYAHPASAQGMSGNNTPLDEDIQVERQKQLSQQQKYVLPKARPTVPGASVGRSYGRGTIDATGRNDLSGRAAPGYPTVRDGSLSFSTSYYSRGHRVPVKRPQAPSLFPGVGARRRSR